MVAGVAFALTVVSSIQSLLGVHVGAGLGTVVVLACVIASGLIGGWAGGLGERRVP